MYFSRFGPARTALCVPFRWAVLARYAGVFLSLSLLAGCLSGEASIGVVDSVAIVQDGAPGRNAVAHLAQVRDVLQRNFTAVAKKLESYPDAQQAQEILQASQEALQRMLKAHEQQINSQLTELFQSSVRECRAAKKLTAIFAQDSLLDYDPALNVSAAVLALFDKKTLRLPPMPAFVADPPLPAALKAAVGKRPAVEEKPKAAVVPKAGSATGPQSKDDTRRK